MSTVVYQRVTEIMAGDEVLSKFSEGLCQAKSIDSKLKLYYEKTKLNVATIEAQVRDIVPFYPVLLTNFGLQGSSVDGGYMARNFNMENLTINLIEEELDMTFTLATIPAELQERFVENGTTPGYLKVVNNEETRKCFNVNYEDLAAYISGPKYLNARHVFELTSSRGGVAELDTDIYQYTAKFLFGKEYTIKTGLDDWDNEDVANTVTIDITKPEEKMRTVLDHVPIIQLQFWPKHAEQWLMTKGKWPSQAERQGIVTKHFCALVTKTPSPDKSDEWRISFSDVESHILDLMLNDKVKGEKIYIAYFLFKSLFYRYIKEIKCQKSTGSKSSIPSFVVKTTFLRMSEEHGPTDQCWDSPLKAVQMLLDHLVSMLKRRYVTHYILPDVNIIQRIADNHKLIEDAVEKLIAISANIKVHLGTFYDDFEKTMLGCTRIFNKIYDFLEVSFATITSIQEGRYRFTGLLDRHEFMSTYKRELQKRDQQLNPEDLEALEKLHELCVQKVKGALKEKVQPEFHSILENLLQLGGSSQNSQVGTPMLQPLLSSFLQANVTYQQAQSGAAMLQPLLGSFLQSNATSQQSQSGPEMLGSLLDGFLQATASSQHAQGSKASSNDTKESNMSNFDLD